MRTTSGLAILAGLFLWVGQLAALPITLDSIQPEVLTPGIDYNVEIALAQGAVSSEQISSPLPFANISLLAAGGLVFLTVRYRRSKKRQWRRIQDEINHRMAV